MQDPGSKNIHQLNTDRLPGSGFVATKDGKDHVALQSTEPMSPTTLQNKANALFDKLPNDREAAQAKAAKDAAKKKPKTR